jgi:hypothetical protein
MIIKKMLSANFATQYNDNIGRVMIMTRILAYRYPWLRMSLGICGDKKAKMGEMERFAVVENNGRLLFKAKDYFYPFLAVFFLSFHFLAVWQFCPILLCKTSD